MTAATPDIRPDDDDRQALEKAIAFHLCEHCGQHEDAVEEVIAAGFVRLPDPADLEDRRVAAVERVLIEYGATGLQPWYRDESPAEAIVAAVLSIEGP